MVRLGFGISIQVKWFMCGENGKEGVDILEEYTETSVVQAYWAGGMAVQDEAVNWVGVGSRRFVDLVQGPESYFKSHENHF